MTLPRIATPQTITRSFTVLLTAAALVLAGLLAGAGTAAAQPAGLRLIER